MAPSRGLFSTRRGPQGRRPFQWRRPTTPRVAPDCTPVVPLLFAPDFDTPGEDASPAPTGTGTQGDTKEAGALAAVLPDSPPSVRELPPAVAISKAATVLVQESPNQPPANKAVEFLSTGAATDSNAPALDNSREAQPLQPSAQAGPIPESEAREKIKVSVKFFVDGEPAPPAVGPVEAAVPVAKAAPEGATAAPPAPEPEPPGADTQKEQEPDSSSGGLGFFDFGAFGASLGTLFSSKRDLYVPSWPSVPSKTRAELMRNRKPRPPPPPPPAPPAPPPRTRPVPHWTHGGLGFASRLGNDVEKMSNAFPDPPEAILKRTEPPFPDKEFLASDEELVVVRQGDAWHKGKVLLGSSQAYSMQSAGLFYAPKPGKAIASVSGVDAKRWGSLHEKALNPLFGGREQIQRSDEVGILKRAAEIFVEKGNAVKNVADADDESIWSWMGDEGNVAKKEKESAPESSSTKKKGATSAAAESVGDGGGRKRPKRTPGGKWWLKKPDFAMIDYDRAQQKYERDLDRTWRRVLANQGKDPEATLAAVEALISRDEPAPPTLCATAEPPARGAEAEAAVGEHAAHSEEQPVVSWAQFVPDADSGTVWNSQQIRAQSEVDRKRAFVDFQGRGTFPGRDVEGTIFRNVRAPIGDEPWNEATLEMARRGALEELQDKHAEKRRNEKRQALRAERQRTAPEALASALQGKNAAPEGAKDEDERKTMKGDCTTKSDDAGFSRQTSPSSSKGGARAVPPESASGGDESSRTQPAVFGDSADLHEFESASETSEAHGDRPQLQWAQHQSTLSKRRPLQRNPDFPIRSPSKSAKNKKAASKGQQGDSVTEKGKEHSATTERSVKLFGAADETEERDPAHLKEQADIDALIEADSRRFFGPEKGARIDADFHDTNWMRKEWNFKWAEQGRTSSDFIQSRRDNKTRPWIAARGQAGKPVAVSDKDVQAEIHRGDSLLEQLPSPKEVRDALREARREIILANAVSGSSSSSSSSSSSGTSLSLSSSSASSSSSTSDSIDSEEISRMASKIVEAELGGVGVRRKQF